MIFKDKLKDTPRENLNWHLWMGVLVFGLCGASRGLDEGLIGTSAEQPSFKKRFGLDDPSLSAKQHAELLSNITSMVQMGSILGALVGFWLTDKLGRLWATRQLCLVWAAGIAIFLGSAAKGSIGMLYAGRFIAGVGIGQTTVVAPTYLAETAPKAIRGMCVLAFSGNVYVGIMLAYFASYGSNLHIASSTQAQWLVPNSMHLMFAFLIFCLSFAATESPRWLYKKGRGAEAEAALCRIRGLPVTAASVQTEILAIHDALERENEAIMGVSFFGKIKELLCSPANQYRIMLSVFSQLLGQWSGANSITIYAPQYFAMMGTTGDREKLFATAIFGLVKLISSILCALFLIDFIGRKRSLMSGIGLQFVSMLYMAIFLVIDKSIDDKNAPQTASQKSAAMGAIVMIYFSGFGWALGWNSIQYLINSEIYPIRLRAIGGSIAMTFHFVNQYGNSKAVPLMFLSLTTGGTMFFFSAVTLIGLAWAWFFLPETAGASLEALDSVFNLPWYMVGRKGKMVAQQADAAEREVLPDVGKEKDAALHVECVEMVDSQRA